jgi:hypothetical protein
MKSWTSTKVMSARVHRPQHVEVEAPKRAILSLF